jgi:hypothetical protein
MSRGAIASALICAVLVGFAGTASVECQTVRGPDEARGRILASAFKGVSSTQTAARWNDPLWNGLLIGAAAGALLGLIPDHYDDCEECHDSLYASVAVGAGVGVLVDALRRKTVAAPSRTDGLTLTVQPRRAARGVGVFAQFRF